MENQHPDINISIALTLVVLEQVSKMSHCPIPFCWSNALPYFVRKGLKNEGYLVQRREDRKNVIPVFRYLKCDCIEGWIRFFSVALAAGLGAMASDLLQRKFGLEIRKHFLWGWWSIGTGYLKKLWISLPGNFKEQVRQGLNWDSLVRDHLVLSRRLE